MGMPLGVMRTAGVGLTKPGTCRGATRLAMRGGIDALEGVEGSAGGGLLSVWEEAAAAPSWLTSSYAGGS